MPHAISQQLLGAGEDPSHSTRRPWRWLSHARPRRGSAKDSRTFQPPSFKPMMPLGSWRRCDLERELVPLEIRTPSSSGGSVSAQKKEESGTFGVHMIGPITDNATNYNFGKFVTNDIDSHHAPAICLLAPQVHATRI